MSFTVVSAFQGSTILLIAGTYGRDGGSACYTIGLLQDSTSVVKTGADVYAYNKFDNSFAKGIVSSSENEAIFIGVIWLKLMTYSSCFDIQNISEEMLLRLKLGTINMFWRTSLCIF